MQIWLVALPITGSARRADGGLTMEGGSWSGAIARGDASIYLRLPTIKGYEENIWDHASGWLLVREAGGTVTDARGAQLDFSLGRTLKNNSGVIATNGHVHAAVLAAVASVLAGKL
jgi:3'(2'), 5'-bisphosphate nucleotidase